MGRLEEPVARRLRADPDGFEKDVVLRITCHLPASTGVSLTAAKIRNIHATGAGSNVLRNSLKNMNLFFNHQNGCKQSESNLHHSCNLAAHDIPRASDRPGAARPSFHDTAHGHIVRTFPYLRVRAVRDSIDARTGRGEPT
jgi:hypothetical protein